MLEVADEKLRQTLHPVAYLVIKLVFQVMWQFVLAFREVIKSTFPASFAKCVRNDIVLITGGGSGIGRLMARKLAARGAVVVSLDVNEKANMETVKLIKDEGYEAVCYTCDLSKKSEVERICYKVKTQVGPVSILINNAGIVSGKPFLQISDDQIIRTFEVNVMAHFWTTKAFLPEMIANGKGHIVTVASMAGQAATNKLSDYCAAKFANVGFDEALRTELYMSGLADTIHTTVICPYYINTGMFQGVQSKIIPIMEPEFVAEESVKAILLNKQVCLLPWYSCYLTALRAILPTRGFIGLADTFGFNNSMDQFQGRKQ